MRRQIAGGEVRTGSRSETCSGTSRDVLRYKQGRAQVNATPLGARADHLLSCEYASPFGARADHLLSCEQRRAQVQAGTCSGKCDASRRASRSLAQLRAETCSASWKSVTHYRRWRLHPNCFTPKSGGASHPAIGPDERRRLTPQRDSDIQSELFCTSP